MIEVPKSNSPDPDMQAAPRALLRAALRAREIAYRTGTPLVIMRDGVVVEEMVTEKALEDFRREVEESI